MAHFAKIGLNNIVTEVLVVANRETMDAQGNEQESIGIEFLKTLTGHETWIQTSYNGNIRKNLLVLATHTTASVMRLFLHNRTQAGR
jgi:hypothetical protein